MENNELISIENSILNLQDKISDNIELNNKELTCAIIKILDNILDIILYLKRNEYDQ